MLKRDVKLQLTN